MRRRKFKATAPKVTGTQVGDDVLLMHGDCIAALRLMPDNSVDSCVVDGPYGLEFMGEEWDGAGIEETAKSAGGFGKDASTNENAYAAARVRYGAGYAAMLRYQDRTREWAAEVYRVLKPGGFILSMGGSRTYHRMACGVEDAGFEVRDMVEWLYGSGFPKSHNVYEGLLNSAVATEEEAEEWKDWGTALKPAHEPVLMARKPLAEKTVARNVYKLRTGALNIGASRIIRDSGDIPGWHKSGADGSKGFQGTETFKVRQMSAEEIQERCGDMGRWPSNVILDEAAGAMLDVQARQTSRFFYTPKPSKAEKDAGLEEFAEQAWVQFATANGTSGKASSISEGRNTARRNIHPTIKPVAFMRYLCTLITPPGGTVLDPMMGSGTTGVAAVWAGFRFIGIEKENTEKRPFYRIAVARLKHAVERLWFHQQAKEIGYEGRMEDYGKWLQTEKAKVSCTLVGDPYRKSGFLAKRRKLRPSSHRV